MRNWLMILTLWLALPSIAQTGGILPASIPEATEEAQIEMVVGRAELAVESAFIRELPTRESGMVASVFEDDILEVVGRNMDGLWFLVRRPHRIFNLGWIAVELLDYDFAAETLPMEDFETGLIGTSPINPDHIPVVLTAESNLRAEPALYGEIVAVIPLGAIIPATGRDTEGLWLYVNFRGIEGWINSSVFQRPPNMLELPDLTFDPNLPQISSLIIPPELQLEQLVSFRNYVEASHDVSNQLAPLWEEVADGEVMPCEPPDFVLQYLVGNQDVRELPELNRHVPRYNQGVRLLNEAIEPLYQCGVLMPDVVIEARNDAINATIIMRNTISQLDQLEEQIRETNRLDPSSGETGNP